MVVENKTILIVDDDEDIREFLGDLLMTEGYTIESAESGALGIETAERAKPDLVLLDIMMPAMDGYEVCENLKANAATRDIPVVMVTVKNDIADISRSLVTGAAGFVVKPFDTETLLQVVEMVLTRRPFDFYAGAEPVYSSEGGAEAVRSHDRIVFLDLQEPGGRNSVLLPADKAPGNVLLHLWQEAREEGVVQTTAAVSTGSSDEFDQLLSIIADRPTVSILACHVYDRDVPIP